MIRTAKIADIDRIMEIYRVGKEIQIKSGNPNQWQNGYPRREIIEEDIKKEQCYVADREGTIDGVFCFHIGEDPDYRHISEGQWLNNDEYGVIHRLASAGRGVFKEMLEWCRGKISNIKIDTHEDNSIMKHLLLSNGFKYCGKVYIDGVLERIAFQISD